ncbi:hypothetical protein BDQ17DRAFT_501645 [Cyathus striatus]|nr:hypothetical protein BDQ17DRAFT_501645 [Cyathus striatus]
MAICGYVLPPEFMLDPSLSRGPDSAWNMSTRMKKSIIAVCRSWYYIAVPLLYQNVVFRRRTQIPALQVLDSLRANPSLVAFVKRIHLNCYFPPSMIDVCFESMAEIYQYCNELSSLDVFFVSGYYFGHNPIATLPVPNPQNLTILSCDIQVIFSFPHAYWGTLRNNLTELHLVLNSYFDYYSLLTGSLHFPSVVSLRCFTVQGSFKGFPRTLYFPSLLQLTLSAKPPLCAR